MAATRDAAGAKLRYFNPAVADANGVIEIEEVAGMPKEEYKRRRHAITLQHEVTVWDARSQPGGLEAFELEVHGIMFVEAPKPVEHWSDLKAVREEYYVRVAELAKKHAPGASHAFVLSHALRSEKPATPGGAYAGFAHVDYGPGSESQWRRLLVKKFGMPESEASSCEICAMNLWHPFDRPAFKNPLCLLDFTSIALPGDTVMYNYVGYNPVAPPEASKEGKLRTEEANSRSADWALGKKVNLTAAPALGAVYAPNHRWVYCSDMRTDEAWLFKQYDTREGVAKCTFHNSFYDPFHDAWKECPGRRSVESRILLTFPKPGVLSKPTTTSSRL